MGGGGLVDRDIPCLVIYDNVERSCIGAGAELYRDGLIAGWERVRTGTGMGSDRDQDRVSQRPERKRTGLETGSDRNRNGIGLVDNEY